MKLAARVMSCPGIGRLLLPPLRSRSSSAASVPVFSNPSTSASPVPPEFSAEQWQTPATSAGSGWILDEESQKKVFSTRPTSDLLRALTVLNICAFDFFVDHNLKLMRIGERLLGKRLLRLLAQPFYKQFVAGSQPSELQDVAMSLRADNVRLMLTMMLEADIGERKASDSQLEQNLEEMLRQVRLVRSVAQWQEQPAVQTKITAHLDADLLVHASRVFESCTDITLLVERLAEAMVTSGQVTVPGLTTQQQKAWDGCVHRLKHLGDVCSAEDVTLYVDAEFTYTNPAISWLTLALMVALNHHQPTVRNTYQCYLKRARWTFEREYSVCRALGACFGAKLVRGAYLERERQTAQSAGRPSPVCDGYADTTNSYTQTADFALRRAAEDAGRTKIMVATHNRDSILQALRLGEQLGLSRPPAVNTTLDHRQDRQHQQDHHQWQDNRMVFAQLYGMADYLTLPLARAGYSVYKAVPFGDFTTVMPYLARRAAENRLVLSGVRLERHLLLHELRQRLWARGTALTHSQ